MVEMRMFSAIAESAEKSVTAEIPNIVCPAMSFDSTLTMNSTEVSLRHVHMFVTKDTDLISRP
jgi:hypothetical protein